jgi:SNF2 family DNA or RNA helicase
MRPHQVEGVKFMFECLTGKKGSEISGCILADYMGLGKTLQALTLLYTLLNLKRKNAKQFKKAIVVSPLTLVNNWNTECKKWLGDRLQPIVALGDGK